MQKICFNKEKGYNNKELDSHFTFLLIRKNWLIKKHLHSRLIESVIDKNKKKIEKYYLEEEMKGRKKGGQSDVGLKEIEMIAERINLIKSKAKRKIILYFKRSLHFKKYHFGRAKMKLKKFNSHFQCVQTVIFNATFIFFISLANSRDFGNVFPASSLSKNLEGQQQKTDVCELCVLLFVSYHNWTHPKFLAFNRNFST